MRGQWFEPLAGSWLMADIDVQGVGRGSGSLLDMITSVLEHPEIVDFIILDQMCLCAVSENMHVPSPHKTS